MEQIERVAVAFEKFGQNRSSRSRDRSGDRDRRDSRRSSNDRYSRSSSRSPDRGSYDRRSYSSYKDNSRDRYNRYDDRYDRRDRYSRERSRSPGDNYRGYRGRSNSGSRYQGSRPPPKKCSFCGRTGHQIEVCWDFQKYLEKIGKQLIKVKDGQSSKKRNDEDSSDKAFVMQSVNSLLEDLGLDIESTNY